MPEIREILYRADRLRSRGLLALKFAYVGWRVGAMRDRLLDRR